MINPEQGLEREAHVQYVATKKANIVAYFPHTAVVLPIDDDGIHRAIHTTKRVEMQREIVHNGALPLSSELSHVTESARSYINALRVSIGLPEVSYEAMDVSYLNSFEFERYHQWVYKQEEGSGTLAFQEDVGSPAVIRMDNYPAFYLGSVAFHELMHRFLEAKTGIYAIDPEPIPGMDVHDLYYQSARSGLSVRHASGELIFGELVNELCNNYYQATFLKKLLTENPDIFATEIANRKRYIADLLPDFDESKYLEIDDEQPDGTIKKFILSKDNLHFSPDGEPLLYTDARYNFLLMQFAEDLVTLCGEADGEPFSHLLLRAKVNPPLQSKIRQVVDEKMGEGFYSKLYKAQYSSNDFLDLFLAVQEKVYV